MGKRRNTEEPGNSMAAAAAVTRTLLRAGETLARAENIFDSMFQEELYIHSMRIVCPGPVRADYLVVISATADATNVVCFHNADTLLEAVVGALNRLENKSAVWKEDAYRK